MKWAWRMVAGLCVVAGCGPENLPVAGAAENEAGFAAARSVGLITVEPDFVAFPSTRVGQATTCSVHLHNPGQSLAQVLLGIPEPFSVALTVVNLQPGEDQTVDLRLDPAQPGIARTALVVQSDDQRLELPVTGEVKPAPGTGSPSRMEARN